MHDFHLADTIYKTIVDYAALNKLAKVTRAVIELGIIVEHGEEILPDNLRFNIKMLAAGGIASGINLKINTVVGDSWTLKEIEGE